ncbi:MAG: GNAT family N-acetyltransferase [Pusillimonas sp.]
MFYETEDLRNSEIFLKLRETSDEKPEKRWLPAYHFDICLLDGTLIGKCDLRIGHNDKTYVGGNIGYAIYEPHRGHRYAAKACELMFKQAKKHKMDHIIITCAPDNIASSKTCELAGGKFLEIAPIPEDNEMYTPERKNNVVKIYRFDFSS